MKYPLEVGVLTGPVTVGFVEKPDMVWLSLDVPREALMDKLETAKLKKLEKVESGSVAATVFSEDGALYRVSVLGVDGAEAEVRYCDYGNMEKKWVGELFMLPDDLAKHEQLAARVRVEGVKGVADSSKNRARVEKKLSVEGLMIKVVEDKEGLVGSFEVGGKKIKFSKNKEPGTTEDPKVQVKPEKKETLEKNVEKKVESKVVDESSAKIDEAINSFEESPKEKVVADVSPARNEVVNEVVKGDERVNVDEEASVPEVSVTAVKVPVSSGKMVMFSQLPNLKLLEGVEISGTVVYVSPLGGIWFCPQWIQVSLDTMTVNVDVLDAEGKLEKLQTANLKEGLLCISRSAQDGELYRARVVTVEKVTVSFIDFGNTEVVSVDDVYKLPSGLEMMAPASAEVMLARDLPKQKTQEVLEETLMEVENLVLVLEKDKTGARVGKFYIDGKEIKWDLMIQSKKVSEKDRVDDENNEDEEDVVIESETAVQESEVKKKEPEVKKKLDFVKTIPEVIKVKKPEVVEMKKPEVVEMKKPEVVEMKKPEVVEMKKPEVVEMKKPEVVEMKKPEVVEMKKPDVVEMKKPDVVEMKKQEVVKKPEVAKKQPEVKCRVVEVPPVVKVSPSLPKLIRMVPAIPLEAGHDEAVFVVHVESVKMVWVCREEDEVRVSLLMDKLARLAEELKPAQRMKKGAVYGARFSQDGELYRVVLKEAMEGRVVVQFIDFGNKETKEEKELYDIPEEIGLEPAAAVGVGLKNDFVENDDNRAVVEEKLDGENLTVVVTEDGLALKICTSSTIAASEEMITLQDIKHPSPPTKLSGSEDQQSSVAVYAEVPAVKASSEVPSAVGASSEVPVAVSAYSKAPSVAVFSEAPSRKLANPLLSVGSVPPVLTSKVMLTETEVPLSRPATVPIPPPSVPQPVPTRTFAKAISALQSQLLSRPRTSTGGRKEAVKTKQVKENVCPWSAGDKVVARWPDGVWRQATVSKLEVSDKVNVVSEGVDEVMVDLINVRPHSMPVEALNLIDQGLVNSNVVRQKGDGASIENKGVTPTVVGKVKEWMDKNMNQLVLGGGVRNTEFDGPMSSLLESNSKQSLDQTTLPPSQDLAGYSRTSKGSLHIQSILTTANPQLSSHVLSSLLTGSPGPLSLMTSPKSSYVIQKLITVIPSPQLQPLLSIFLSYFTQLSLDSSGCRVVQSMLEFSSPDQQKSITSLLCNTKTLLTLASDRHGTYVAQACLPHLTPNPTALLALVNSVQGYTAMLGQHQCGTFFLQRLVGVLSTHYPGSGAACLLQEDILASLSQLVITEPGSRLVQAMLKDAQPTTVVRVARWVEENIKVAVITKPAAYVALAVFDQIIERLAEEGSWTSLLERLVLRFIGPDKESPQKQSIFLTAALHQVGHLLAREVVSKVNFMSDNMKMDVMRVLASEVDRLSADKFGSIVLKGLAESVI